MILRPNGKVLDYTVVRQGDPTLGEPELTTDSAAEQALSRQVAALGAPDGADAGDPGLVLGSFGIRWVLLPGPVDPALAERLDAALGLDALTSSSSYDLWQVSGPVARARVIAADGTVTPLTANQVSMSGTTAPANGGTLVLAEPYGGWTATLNGHALRPVATAVDGWAQGFVLPAGGGKLSLGRNDLAREASLLAELIVLLAVCMLALPGKRADPAEQAEAMAALQAARDARRASRGSRRFARGPADPDVAGVGVAEDDLAAAATAETATAETATAETAGRRGRIRRPGVAIAGLGSARLAMTRRRGGSRKADGEDDYRGDDFGPDDLGAGDFGRDELPETVPAAEWPVGATAGGHGEAGFGEQAPWDMVGDWGSGGRRDNADPWTQPASQPPAESAQAAPWEAASWGTGPQPLPSGTGPQASPRWQTGPQAPPPGTGPRPPITAPDAGQLAGMPTGWNRDTGEWERAARAERPGRFGEPAYPVDDDYPAGPADESGPWPTATAGPGATAASAAACRARPGKPERHSHRASKHGRPSRWRGSADRPGRDGES